MSVACEYGKATILALTLSSHNLPTDRVTELFEPTKEEKHLLGSVFEKSGTLCLNTFRFDVTTREAWKFLDDVTEL